MSGKQKLFAVYHANKCIGIISFKNINQINRNTELYISLKKYTGGGETDPVDTLVNFYFMHLNLHKSYLCVFESNQKAISCDKKLDSQLKENCRIIILQRVNMKMC